MATTLTHRARVLIVTLSIALAYTMGTWYAHALTSRSRVPIRNVHSVTVVCNGWAEDSAAHLRLVLFGNGVAVYRCERHGY